MAGEADCPIELTVGGDKATDQEPDKFYKFILPATQNISIDITNHKYNSDDYDYAAENLTITLHPMKEDGSCDTDADAIAQTTSKEKNFSLEKTDLAGGKKYCIEMSGYTGGVMSSADKFDIQVNGSATLEIGVSNASAKEDESPLKFIVVMTKASSSDVHFTYYFTDKTAVAGTNYDAKAEGQSHDCTSDNPCGSTIEAGKLSTEIDVPLYDTDMNTSKTFTVTIASADVDISGDDRTATGTIYGSAATTGGSDSDCGTNGKPCICYDSRETSGFCMFGSCIFYQETTNVRALGHIQDVKVIKALTRGWAFMDFLSQIGIGDAQKTIPKDSDQAEKRTLFDRYNVPSDGQVDFIDNSYFLASFLPTGIVYRLGDGADNTHGGSMDAGDTTSYYDKSLFKLGLFTAYTHIITYTKDGQTYQEVLQPCQADTRPLPPSPMLDHCGIFPGPLNSHNKIVFKSRSWQEVQDTDKLITPEVDDTQNTSRCNGVTPCPADGIGSSVIDLPEFLTSSDTQEIEVPTSVVIGGKLEVGKINITQPTDYNTTDRYFVFEAPYSESYGGRMMLINKISDKGDDPDHKHIYVFKDGDYWIDTWEILGNKNVTIKVPDKNVRVRIFVKNATKFDISGTLNIGQENTDMRAPTTETTKLFFYFYDNFQLMAHGSKALYYTFIYAKGNIDIGIPGDLYDGDGAIATKYGSITADGQLTIGVDGPGAYTPLPDNLKSASMFDVCAGNGTNYLTGPFDAWDIFRDNVSTPPTDRNISTKIVDQGFKISVASLNKENNAYEVKEGNGGSVEVGIYKDGSTLPEGPSFIFEANTTAHIANFPPTGEFNVTKAIQKARVGFKFCASYDYNASVHDKIYYIYDGSHCSGDVQECNATSSTPVWRVCYAEDAFAIRPFAFRIFGNNQYKRAGYDFNLTIKAVDQHNFTLNSGIEKSVNGVDNYNVTLSDLTFSSAFYIPNETETRKMNQDVYGSNENNMSRVANCPYAGIFNVTNPSSTFNNGEINATINFSETGVLTVTLSETPGHEFAKVDADDSNDSVRLIRPASTIYDINDINKTDLMLFIPYEFNTTAEYKTYINGTTSDRNWLYQSSDVNRSVTTYTTPQMAAYIVYKITAQNKQHQKTKNFTATCFPDVADDAPKQNGLKLNSTFDLLLDATIHSDREANISLYCENNQSAAIWTYHPSAKLSEGNNAIQEWISPKQFESGTGMAKVYFNIDRNNTKALNPISLTVIDANTSTSWMSNPGATKRFLGTSINRSKIFFYGRLHAPDYQTYKNSITTPIYAEVFCNLNKTQRLLYGMNDWNESVDDVNWWINPNHSLADGNIASLTPKIGFTNQNDTQVFTTVNDTLSNGIFTSSQITFTGTSKPHKTQIRIGTQPWLKYHRFISDPNKIPYFVIDFLGGGGWAGVGAKGKTLPDINGTNERIEW